MKSTFFILIILALGAVYFFLSQEEIPILDLNEGVLIMADGSIKGNYSIEDVLDVNTPYECNFNKTDEMSQVNGLVRIAENKVRADFDIQINPQATNFGDANTDQRAFFASHFIIKEGITYTWTSLQNTGYKTPILTSSEAGASKEAQAQILGFKDKVPLECKPWNAVLNAFDLPTGINFVDLE
jgi:hypothetical protein